MAANGADFLTSLLGGNGCSVDGMMSNNPLTSLVDRVLNSNILEDFGQSLSNSVSSASLAYSTGDTTNSPIPYNNAMLSNNHISDGSVFDQAWSASNANGYPAMQHSNPNNPYLAMMHRDQQMRAMHMQQQQYHQMLMHQAQANRNHATQEHTSSSASEFTMHAEVIQDIGDEYRYSDDILDSIQQINLDEVDEHVWLDNNRGQSESLQQSELELDTNTYIFQPNNPATTTASTSTSTGHYERGLVLFGEGRVTEAILAFEAALQQDDSLDECWRYLGLCWAELDEDGKAILCYHKALDQDAYNMDALIGLGTSYTNELNSSRALQCIQDWVHHHPHFYTAATAAAATANTTAGHGVGQGLGEDAYGDGTELDRTIQLMLAVTQLIESPTILTQPGTPSSTSITASMIIHVYTLLGVLYNVSGDYDAASHAFRSALNYSPNDYTLWNKLGATLANSNSSTQALEYYQKALATRPQYVRGLINQGIAYANISNYTEAAKSYIRALTATTMPNAQGWGYLRIALQHMNRMDLLHHTYDVMDSTSQSQDNTAVVLTALKKALDMEE